MADNQACFIIDLIGSSPKQARAINVIDEYYQPINAILIRDLAIKFFGISETDIRILAYGTEEEYRLYNQTYNKWYFQIDINNYFQMDINKNQLNFNYFKDFDKAIEQIRDDVSDNSEKIIFLFLDDHGTNGYFSRVAYYKLYTIIMNFPETKFFIFNDSCYSGSFIEFVEAYEKIYNLKIENEKIEINLQVLFAFKFIFEYINEKIKSDNPIDDAIKFIDFYQKVQIKDEKLFTKIKDTYILDGVTFDTIQEIFTVNLEDIGIKTITDMKVFQMMIQSYEETTKKDKDSSKYYKDIFTKVNLDIFIKLSNNNIQEFIKALNALYIAKDEIDFNLKPTTNIEIITSTDGQHKCSSFPSIKISDALKINPGSPTMGSFIKELFLKGNNYIDYENVKKETSEVDGKSIFYALDLIQNVTNTKKKTHWIHFNPKHYKTSDIKYSLEYSKKMKKQIAALRAISFINVQNLTKTAESLCKEITLTDPNPFNDTNADILAITALINEQNNNHIELIRECFRQNKVIRNHKPMRINSASLIIEFSFLLFKDPIQATGIIINILESAVKNVVQQKLQLIIKDEKTEYIANKLFMKQEISKLKELQIDKSLENNDLSKIFSFIFNDKKYNFISKIENVILALLGPSSIAFATIIASSFFNEIKLDTIKETFLDYCRFGNDNNFYGKDDAFVHFLKYINDKGINTKNINNINDNEKDKIEIIRKYAESYLFECTDTLFTFVDSIFDAQIKSDSMKLVSICIQNVNSFSIVYVLNDILNDELNNLFINNIIDPIEKIIKENEISSFFIPSIICSIPAKMIIYALYIAASSFEKDWYNNLLKIIEAYKDDDYYGGVCVEIIKLIKGELSKQLNIKNINQYQINIDQMKTEISKEIKNAITKLTKLQEISIINARENIIKRMDANIIDQQTNSYIGELKFDTKIKNKFDEYLLLSKNELYTLNKKNKIINSHEKIPTKHLDVESLKDTKNIYERAAKELHTVAYLFKISDDLPAETIFKLTSKIDDDSAVEFPIITMIARCFNIVEISPISKEINTHFKQFNPSEGSNPTLRELMGLQSSVIQINHPECNANNCYKIVELKGKDAEEKEIEIERIEKEIFYTFNINNIQDDDNDDNAFWPPSILQLKPLSKSKPFKNLTIKRRIRLIDEYQKLRISQAEIILARENLKLGCSQWENDAWKAFIYCFNIRIKKTGIQFNEKDDYNNDQCPSDINEGIKIVMKFYPLQEVSKFWKNKKQIEMFIGKYRMHYKEITQAFVRSFDDVDQIISPMYFNKKTYEECTLERLSSIYDY